MDPLSDTVSILRPHDCVAAGLDAGGQWSVRFERHAGLKCNAVLKGHCWLSVEGMEEPQRLEAGDCVVLPKGLSFVLSANAVRLHDDTGPIYTPVSHGGTAVYGRGGDFFMTGSRFLLSGQAASILLDTLPTVVIVRSGSQQDAIEWSLKRIAEELRTQAPGCELSIAHLSHFVLIQVLRCYINTVSANTAGWLAAIADRHIVKAITAMHDDPARSWTVQELASQAGLSRTAFANRFRRVAGQTPMSYLTQWRILCAADRLRQTEATVAQIAMGVGYASESAFTVAFKREMGEPPRQYARQSRLSNELALIDR